MSQQPETRGVVVQLVIPENIWFQLVYRQRRTEPFAVEALPGYQYHFAARPGALRHIAGAVKGLFGTAGLLKTFAKLMTGTRMFYCVTKDGEAVNYGWMTVSRCRQYRIEPNEVVIGPIWTRPDERGKGLATFGLKMGINSMIARGNSVFYIDTSNDNVATQKVIAKCEFGPPVAVYLRGPLNREQ